MKQLIEKYAAGKTTLGEERTLRDYFCHATNVPGEWKAYAAMFRFFDEEIERNRPAGKRTAMRAVTLRRVGTAAAIGLLFAAGAKFYYDSRMLQPASHAFVDGKPYTDLDKIGAETLKTLAHLAEGNDEVYASQIEALNTFFE
jgi:hypothetical protein